MTTARPFGSRFRLPGVLVTLLALAVGSPVFAQTDPPEDAHVLFESLALSPAFGLTEVGWDDNVLRVANTDRPTGDFTATFSAALQAWFRLQRVKMRGRSRFDFVYFDKFSQFRSIDSDNSAHVDLLLGRLTPYVEGTWTNTRERNFEIDIPVRRLESNVDAGVDVRLTGKTRVGVMTQRLESDYNGETVYLDTNLAQYLNAVAKAGGVRFRFAATPFTTVGVDVEQNRSTFPKAQERNSEGYRVMSVIEFQPLAQINGNAHVGITKRTFVDGGAPPFQGFAGRIDLAYTLLGRTRFGVDLLRDLSNSYRADERDYLQTSVQLSVTEQIASAWDLRGTVGHFTLAYATGDPADATSPLTRTTETGMIYGAELGYQMGRTRIAFQVERQTRTSEFSALRGYEQMRIMSSATYRF